MATVLKKDDHIVSQWPCKAWGKLHKPKEYYLKKGYIEVEETADKNIKSEKDVTELPKSL